MAVMHQTLEPLTPELFRDMIDQVTAAIYTTDAEGRLTYYNEAAARLWGYRPDLGLAQWCGSWKLYWPDGRAMPHEESPMAMTLKEGKPCHGREAIAERPDGIRVPFVPFPTPIFDIAGRLTGAINILVDITDRKRAEISNQRLISIIESSDDAIISKDLNGIVTSWNRGAERIFGYSADEMVGESITTIIPPDRLDEEELILERLKNREKIDHYETVRLCKDGTLIDVSLTVSPLIDSSMRVVGAAKIARDITPQRRLREQQELLLREMRHRIKNVIATVYAIAGQTLEQTPEKEKQAFGARLDALAQATTLGARSWSLPSMKMLVDESLAPFSSAFGSRLALDGPGQLAVDFMDGVSISLALHELATNSIKHGAWLKAAGHVAVRWSAERDGTIRLAWSETGVPCADDPGSDGFGTKLLRRLACTEEGVLQFERGPKGVSFAMKVKNAT